MTKRLLLMGFMLGSCFTDVSSTSKNEPHQTTEPNASKSEASEESDKGSEQSTSPQSTHGKAMIEVNHRCDLYGVHHTWKQLFLREKENRLEKYQGSSQSAFLTDYLMITEKELQGLKKLVALPALKQAIDNQNAFSKQPDRSSYCSMRILIEKEGSDSITLQFDPQLNSKTTEADRKLLDGVVSEFSPFWSKMNAKPKAAKTDLSLSVKGIYFHPKKVLTWSLANTGPKSQTVGNIGVDHLNAEGEWTAFDKDVQCPCESKCESKRIILAPNETLEHTWDYQEGCVAPKPGLYRLVATSVKDGKRTVISNQRFFHIVEPKS